MFVVVLSQRIDCGLIEDSGIDQGGKEVLHLFGKVVVIRHLGYLEDKARRCLIFSPIGLEILCHDPVVIFTLQSI